MTMPAASGDGPERLSRRSGRILCGDCDQVTEGRPEVRYCPGVPGPRGQWFSGIDCDGCGLFAWVDTWPNGWRYIDGPRGAR